MLNCCVHVCVGGGTFSYVISLLHVFVHMYEYKRIENGVYLNPGIQRIQFTFFRQVWMILKGGSIFYPPPPWIRRQF